MTQASEGDRHCPVCGSTAFVHAKFCANCGSSLLGQTNDADEPAVPSKDNSTQTGGGCGKLGLGCLSFLVLVIAGCSTWWALFRDVGYGDVLNHWNINRFAAHHSWGDSWSETGNTQYAQRAITHLGDKAFGRKFGDLMDWEKAYEQKLDQARRDAVRQRTSAVGVAPTPHVDDPCMLSGLWQEHTSECQEFLLRSVTPSTCDDQKTRANLVGEIWKGRRTGDEQGARVAYLVAGLADVCLISSNAAQNGNRDAQIYFLWKPLQLTAYSYFIEWSRAAGHDVKENSRAAAHEVANGIRAIIDDSEVAPGDVSILRNRLDYLEHNFNV